MSLDELSIGAPARVLNVGGERGFRRRLMELGLVPGCPVERLGPPGFGGPIRFRVREGVVALRRSDAHLIDVEPA